MTTVKITNNTTMFHTKEVRSKNNGNQINTGKTEIKDTRFIDLESTYCTAPQ